MYSNFIKNLIVSANNLFLKIWLAQPFIFEVIPKLNNITVIGWGRKSSGKRALKLAKILNVDCLILEDGFLRCLSREDSALSVVSDNKGIYYDATCPSQLESHVSSELSLKENNRAAAIIEEWKAFRLSKYNAASEYSGDLNEPYVLVIDQVANDCSIEYGLANKNSFEVMFKKAILENPKQNIILKIHPDVYTRKKKGNFDLDKLESMPNVRVIADNCHPVKLVECAESVYTVTSQVGFEALIWGKKVRCFGMPFYAGWGLTIDEISSPERRKPASLNQLVHGALIKYTKYIDPDAGTSCELEVVMKYINKQRIYSERTNL